VIASELQEPEIKHRFKPVSVQNLRRVAHHVDSQQVISSLGFAEFVATFLSYQPSWVKALFRVHSATMKLMRVPEEKIPLGTQLKPEDIQYENGHRLLFFKVRSGIEGHQLVLTANNRLLITYLVFERENTPDSAGGSAAYSVTTIVRYRNLAGRCYFYTILPLHYLILGATARTMNRLTPQDHHKPRVPGFISVSEAMNQNRTK